MGINRVKKRGRTRLEVRKRWPDGVEFRRYFPNKKKATEVLSRIECAIADGTWAELRDELTYGRSHDQSVAEYMEHYVEVYCELHNKKSTVQRKENSLAHICRFMGKLRLTQVRPLHVHSFVAARRKEVGTNATVNRDVSVLKHMFEFAVEEGALKHNPIRKIRKLKEYREERPRVSKEQVRQILKHLSFPVHQIVRFIYETGCRPSEALALKRENVDLEKKTAVFNLRKGGDNALVALTSRAVEAIQEIPVLRNCAYVFWNPKTQTRYQRINETFRRAREKAGLPEIQLKDFRRELGIVLAESGQPLHVAQSQLGHSSIKTTEKFYAHYSPEFAVGRAREVLETRGRHPGDTPPPEAPSKNTPEKGASKVVSFQQFREENGGGGRIRTGE